MTIAALAELFISWIANVILTPNNVTMFGDGLDHPEGVCVGPDHAIYAGGEAGQVYRIQPDGSQSVIGSTGGFLLGIALDGQGRIHACDCGQSKVFRIDPDGTVVERSTGTIDRPFVNPNYPVFDSEGNLYVSDSGDYWERERGTGCIMKITPDDTTTSFHDGPLLFANGMAIDPGGEWLYVVQSTAPNVVRMPLAEPNAAPEVTHVLPELTVPDGLAFAADGRLVISCYKPDIVYVGYPDGSFDALFEDPSAEVLSRPTNAAIHDGKMYIANLGGWHITAVETDMEAATIFRPSLPS